MKTIEIKYCNCQISSNKNIFNPNQYYSFCEKCGCIIIKTRDGDVCYTLKKKEKQSQQLSQQQSQPLSQLQYLQQSLLLFLL